MLRPILVLAGLVVLSGVPLAESTLWDLLITAQVENAPLPEGQNPIISGLIVDHAGKPVANATVQMRNGQGTVQVMSNDTGGFSHELAGLRLLPGEHVVNIRATQGDRIGLGSATFRVTGEITAYAHTQRLLETDEAKKYLGLDPAGLGDNPTGKALYWHYQDLYAKLLEEKAVQRSIDEANASLAEMRNQTDVQTQKIIDEKNPGAGTFSGRGYDVFINKVDPKIKDTIKRQINHTINVFEGARNAMDDVLAQGGTYEDARKVYLEKLAVSREMMEIVTYGNQTEAHKDSNSTLTNSTLTNSTLTNSTLTNSTAINSIAINLTNPIDAVQNASVSLNGTEIQIGLSGSRILLNVNGTFAEFIINGTSIIPVNHTAG